VIDLVPFVYSFACNKKHQQKSEVNDYSFDTMDLFCIKKLDVRRERTKQYRDRNACGIGGYGCKISDRKRDGNE